MILSTTISDKPTKMEICPIGRESLGDRKGEHGVGGVGGGAEGSIY